MSDAFSSPSVKLRRRAAAEYIADIHKQRASYATMCKMAVNGGGPPIHKQSNGDVFYETAELDDWCRSRVLAGTYRTTAEMPSMYRRPGKGREAASTADPGQAAPERGRRAPGRRRRISVSTADVPEVA
jgi:hypothetical protein